MPVRPLSALLLVAALLPASPAGADAGSSGEQAPARFGLTVSTNTFQPAGGRAEFPVAPGLYARAGLCWLPGRRLEFELFHLPRLVPAPYSELFGGISAGCWLFPRRKDSYFNLTAHLALLQGLEDESLLSLRLCPVVLGGPYYHYADRLLAVALVWDVRAARLFWQFQLVGISIFF